LSLPQCYRRVLWLEKKGIIRGIRCRSSRRRSG